MSDILERRILPGGVTMELVKGDITQEDTEAIVNAANAQLMHGGGVAGAISRAGGHTIQEESDAWVREHGPVTHAQPAWTSGGRMSARYVIHAVGPVWGDGDEDAKLEAAIRGSLQAADQLGLKSIAFPAISTGIFGFPKDRAARIMLSALAAHFGAGDSDLRLVRVVLFDEPTVRAFRAAWDAGDA